MRFALALAVLLMTSPSFAQDSAAPLAPAPLVPADLAPAASAPAASAPAALAPGKPAGVAQADVNNHDLFIYLSLSMIAVGAVGMILIFRNNGGSTSPTTTQ